MLLFYFCFVSAALIFLWVKLCRQQLAIASGRSLLMLTAGKSLLSIQGPAKRLLALCASDAPLAITFGTTLPKMAAIYRQLRSILCVDGGFSPIVVPKEVYFERISPKPLLAICAKKEEERVETEAKPMHFNISEEEEEEKTNAEKEKAEQELVSDFSFPEIHFFDDDGSCEEESKEEKADDIYSMFGFPDDFQFQGAFEELPVRSRIRFWEEQAR